MVIGRAARVNPRHTTSSRGTVANAMTTSARSGFMSTANSFNTRSGSGSAPQIHDHETWLHAGTQMPRMMPVVRTNRLARARIVETFNALDDRRTRGGLGKGLASP